MMKKISSESMLRTEKTIPVLGLFVFLATFFLIWGVIFTLAPVFAAHTDISITNSGFSPSNLNVTVTDGAINFFNNDTVTHNVSSNDHPTHTLYPVLNLGDIAPGGSGTVTINSAGTYTYHDHLFPSRSGTITVSSGSTVPATPTGLNATLSGSNVNLSWVDNSSNEVEFIISERLSPATAWNFLVTLGPNTLAYVHSAPSAGTHEYQVVACGSAGAGNCSGPSNLASATVSDSTPTAPTGLTATLSSGTNVNLSWVDNSSNETNFKIYYRLSGSSTWNLANTLGVNILAATHNPGTGSYEFHVVACNGSNCSGMSNVANVTTGGSGSETAPAAPTNLAATVSGNNVTLTWTDNSSNEAGFKIYRGPTWTDIGNVGANVTTFTDSGRSAGTYTYHINAFGSSNIYSSVSNDVSATITSSTGTGTITTPSAPSNLRLPGPITATTVPLAWNDNSSNEDKFTLERKLTTEASWTGAWSTQITTANTTTYTDTSVTSGITYDYRVQACLSGTGCSTYTYLTGILVSTTTTSEGNSTITPTFTPTTATSVPFAPTNLSLNRISTPTFISLYWIDNSDNEDKFNLERKLSGTTAWSALVQTGSNIFYYIDTTAISGMAYDYRVQACLSGTGCSDYANLTRVSVSTSDTTTTSTTSTTQEPTEDSTTFTTTTTSTTFPSPTTQTTTDTINTPNIQGNIAIWEQIDVLQNKLNNTTNSATRASLRAQISALQAQVQTFQSNQTAFRTDTTTTTTTAPAPMVTTNQFSFKIQDLGLAVEGFKTAINDSKEQLTKTINENVADIIKNAEESGQKIDIEKIYLLRDELLKNIDRKLLTLTSIVPVNINNLKIEIQKGITNIKSTAKDTTKTQIENVNTSEITNTLNELTQIASSQNEVLKEQGGNLLYEDSNKDGISDYDSIHVYNIDPNTPSPVSTYEGKTINASEKILLGFDPTQSGLVKVDKEEPVESTIAPVPTYQVKEVALTEKKEVVLKGQALPNSYITIYIYSTPIIVTVKTDSKGEWQYVLDKELENGDHTVYTATVNNSGNIIAKSNGYLFTKTAEAATLKDVPTFAASADINRPGLLEGNNLYIIIMIIALAMIMALVLIGRSSRKMNK